MAAAFAQCGGQFFLGMAKAIHQLAIARGLLDRVQVGPLDVLDEGHGDGDGPVIDGVESDHSLLAATKGVYGESAGEWTPADAVGYARVLSLTGTLQTRASGE